MTYPYINVPQSLTSYGEDPQEWLTAVNKMYQKGLFKDQLDFLKIVRTELKAKLAIERGDLRIKHNFFRDSNMLVFGPQCPICGKIAEEGSLHEVILDRGDVMGVDWRLAVNIMVPWNTAIVHEGSCHQFAQHDPRGKFECISQILDFYDLPIIMEWLHFFTYSLPTSLISNAEWAVQQASDRKRGRK